MTSCPKKLKCREVSTTISPVTQVAEVAVNRASKKGVNSPLREERGRQRSSPPTVMTSRKLATMIWVGESGFLTFFSTVCSDMTAISLLF